MSEAQLAGSIDAVLAARAQQGEMVAFEVLVVKYQRRIVKTKRRVVHDHRIAEELTQEFFSSVCILLPSFKPDGEFAAWLLTIARNAARSYLRGAQNRPDDRLLPVLDEAGEGDRFGVAPSSEDEAWRMSCSNASTLKVAALPGCNAGRG